jgi:hypothetical protein
VRATSCTLSFADPLPSLDVHAALVSVIVVHVGKPWVLSLPGRLQSPLWILASYLFSILSNLTLAAKKTGADSVAVMLAGNVKMTGILPGKGRQVPDAPKKLKQPKAPNPAPSTTAPRPRVSATRRPKPLPKVVWSPVPVPLSFTLDLALPRIAIREFVLRFSKLLDMSRAHLEELEEIGGRRPHEIDDDDDDLEQDIDVEMGWVGETCLRAILLGLLNLYLGTQPEHGDKRGKKAIQDAIQEIKASRANLGRMWSALASLRAEFEKVDNQRIFPDPLPPPQHTKIRTTRSGALNSVGVNVTTTAQLVPVILPLMEMVVDSQAVRDELEEGIKEAKERVKEEKERAKAIREQWEETKKNNNPVRFLSSDCDILECEPAFCRTRRPEQSTSVA